MKLLRHLRSVPLLRGAFALAVATTGALSGQGAAHATLASTAGTLAPALWAQTQAGAAAGGALSGKDLARLRTELARVNAEIDALKKADRNVRDDARLRARLADAEALARRLTEAERAAGPAAVESSPAGVAAAAPVEASPQDAPSDLEAKADILADRARRVGLAAAQLDGRLRAFRTRQELKRAAGQLDQDPFAAFESSKRRVVASGGTALTAASHDAEGAKAASPTLNPISPTSSGTSGLAGSATKGGDSSGPPRGMENTAVGPTPLPPSWGGLETSGTLAFQFRDALDPVTLADIRRLEGSGSANGRALAMQRALVALKAQQDALNAQARLLRARAQAK